MLANRQILTHYTERIYKNTMKLEKTFKNEGGNILVRYCPTKQFGRCGIVEMLHLFHENKSGCVIGAWKEQNGSGEEFVEFHVVHDKLTQTEYSFDIMEAVKFGQKLAEMMVELQNE